MTEQLEVNRKLTLVKSAEDWFCIEWAEHENKHWMAPIDIGGYHTFGLCYSGRVADADVEGTKEEMRAVGEALKRRSHATFRRCAVRYDGSTNDFEIWSPRNSQTSARISDVQAQHLAQEIDRVLEAPRDGDSQSV